MSKPLPKESVSFFRSIPYDKNNMIKKAVIAAAGKGTRMLHLAIDKPKHLIAVNDRPFLYYVLTNLKDAGIEKMILIVGHKKELMYEFAEKYKNEFDIELIDQFEVAGTERYGTAIPVICAKSAVKGESFLTIFGDNLYSPKDIRGIARDDEFGYVSGFHHDHPEKYGVFLSEGEFLKDVIEKPKEFVSNLINTGLAKFTPDIFEVIDRVGVSPRGEYELTDAIRLLAKDGKMKIRKIEDYWFDFGNPDDVIRISEFLKEK